MRVDNAIAMIFMCVFSSVFMVIGGTALINGVYFNENISWFGVIWGGCFFWGGISNCYQATIGAIKLNKLNFIYQTQNLDWYKKNYPQYVHSTNIVQCCMCNNNVVKSYLVKNKTYKVCNYCAKCGEILFYSNEH